MDATAMATATVAAMLVPVIVAVALLGWSVVANLVIGERLYILRNLVVTVLLVGAARAAGRGWRDLGLTPEALGPGLRWGLVAAAVVVAVLGIGVLLRNVVPLIEVLLSDRRAELAGRRLAWQSLVRIPVGTALFEEVAFRGVLLALLLEATSPPWAIVWSSVTFGLWHVAPTIVTLRCNDVPPASAAGVRAILAAVGVTTLAGAAFGVLRAATGSVLAPVLAHWATNAGGLVAAATIRPRAGSHGDRRDAP